MNGGTTWIQHIVYEVLSRGNGDLGDDGHRHRYALSPWIEAPRSSVSMDAAPRIGARKNRMIKTHLPTLGAEESAEIVRKSGFAYMKENEEVFEMAPPSPLASSGSFLASGSREREKQGCDAERDRILAFCRERLRGASYPAERFYPDLR